VFPNKEERLQMEYTNPEKGMVQFLSDHGPYPEKLHRLGLRNSPECECGVIGSPKQMVLYCPLVEHFKEERSILKTCNVVDIVRNPEQYNVLEQLNVEISKIH